MSNDTAPVLQMALLWVSSPGHHLWLWWLSLSLASLHLSSSCWLACAANVVTLVLRWVLLLLYPLFKFHSHRMQQMVLHPHLDEAYMYTYSHNKNMSIDSLCQINEIITLQTPHLVLILNLYSCFQVTV